MNPPTEDTELKPEKLEEEKDSGASFHCDLYDADVVRKIAQEFLPGLASACVDNTTGGLFRSPASVAVDIRREMVDYLMQRSENFVAESVVLDGTPNEEISDNPHDIISDLVDDFSSSKRNFFSRVSGWLLSERREDRIDDFVQEMEINGFWLLNRRESVAQTLLKNVDFKNMYHCNMSFKSQEELEEHKINCGFRTMTCSNEGCDSIFSFAQMENHDSSCPFKILKCEQNCDESIMRREMDRHCITVCPMKLVKCPFHSVGCQSSTPQRTVEQHRSENLSSHLLYVLQVVHKEASVEDLKERAEELIKIASSPGKLATARDARSLTYLIKDVEAKLPPLKVTTTTKTSDGVNNSPDKKSENTNVATRHVRFEDPPSEKKETANLPSVADGSQEKKLEDSQHNNNNSVQESLRESPVGQENSSAKPNTTEARMEKSEQKDGEPVKHENLKSPVKSGEETKKEKLDDSASEKKAGEPVKHDNLKSPINSEGETNGEKHNDAASAEKKVDEPIKQENLTSPIKPEEKTKGEKQDDSAAAEKKVGEPVKQESLKSPTKAEADTKELNHDDSVAAEKKLDKPVKQENLRSPVKAETDLKKDKHGNSVGAEKKVNEPIKQEHPKSPIQDGEETNKEKHDGSAASDKKVHENVKQENSTSPIKAEHLHNKTNADSASAEKMQMEKSSDEKAGVPIKHESLTPPTKAVEHMQRETNAGTASAQKVQTEKPSDEKAGVPIKHENTTPPIKAEEHTKKEQPADTAASDREVSTKRENESTN